MPSPYEVIFISYKSKNFDDYFMQLRGIHVAQANSIMLSDTLNDPNSRYGDGAFNLFGNGFGGYEISYRIKKQVNPFAAEDVIEYIVNIVDQLYVQNKLI